MHHLIEIQKKLVPHHRKAKLAIRSRCREYFKSFLINSHDARPCDTNFMCSDVGGGGSGSSATFTFTLCEFIGPLFCNEIRATADLRVSPFGRNNSRACMFACFLEWGSEFQDLSQKNSRILVKMPTVWKQKSQREPFSFR